MIPTCLTVSGFCLFNGGNGLWCKGEEAIRGSCLSFAWTRDPENVIEDNGNGKVMSAAKKSDPWNSDGKDIPWFLTNDHSLQFYGFDLISFWWVSFAPVTVFVEKI